MFTTFRYSQRHGLVLIAAGLLSACGDGATEPGPAIRLELSGPGEIVPGTSRQFRATAVGAWNAPADVTGRAEWSSSNPAVLSVDANGVAQARVAGEALVIARFSGQSASTTVFALPLGTFRLTGRVLDESGAPIAGAAVRVLGGIGAGLTATTGSPGDYALYGVAGLVRLQAARTGYRTEVADITIDGHRSREVRLQSAATLREVAGIYTLTVAAESCSGGVLPVAARTRTYTATIAQSDTRLDVVLSGAEFIITGGRGDRFSGFIDTEDNVRFVIGEDDASFYYYYYSTAWDVVERFRDREALILHGSVSASAAADRITGSLSGAINLAIGNAPPFGFMVRCRGSHRFSLLRRE